MSSVYKLSQKNNSKTKTDYFPVVVNLNAKRRNLKLNCRLLYVFSYFLAIRLPSKATFIKNLNDTMFSVEPPNKKKLKS